MERGQLNLDIATKTAEFETLVSRILPKKLFYRLMSRGKGLEFEGYRTFGPDEDASLIDWKASVRSNSLLARQYVEERNMNVVFVFDVGENMVFGSQDKLKCEYAVEMAAAFCHSVINSGDQVGFILFNQDIVRINYPVPGKKQFDIFVYNVSDPYVYDGVSDVGNVINKLFEVLNPSVSMIVLVSDFLKINEGHRRSFEKLGNLFETIAVMVRDPLDKSLPDVNKELVIEDYNHERLLINPSLVKKTYEELVEKQTNLVRDMFQSSRIDLLELDTSNDFSLDLANFLKRRVNRRD